MAEPRHPFTWSVQRDRTFRMCLKKYWFTYYGGRNGVLDDPDRLREITILSCLKDRHAWGEEKIREGIQRSLNRIRRGGGVLPAERVISLTLDEMRSEFRSSRSKQYRKGPAGFGLWEHEYEIVVDDDQWKEVARHVETCLRNFFASDIYAGLESHPRDGWLEADPVSAFDFDQISISLLLDCAIKERGAFFIYEWSASHGTGQDPSLPHGCYALYATNKWQAALDAFGLVRVDLPSGQSSFSSVTPNEVAYAEAYIRESTREMQTFLRNVAEDIPMDEERFSRRGDEGIRRGCNFQRLCAEERCRT